MTNLARRSVRNLLLTHLLAHLLTFAAAFMPRYPPYHPSLNSQELVTSSRKLNQQQRIHPTVDILPPGPDVESQNSPPIFSHLLLPVCLAPPSLPLLSNLTHLDALGRIAPFHPNSLTSPRLRVHSLSYLGTYPFTQHHGPLPSSTGREPGIQPANGILGFASPPYSANRFLGFASQLAKPARSKS